MPSSSSSSSLVIVEASSVAYDVNITIVADSTIDKHGLLLSAVTIIVIIVVVVSVGIVVVAVAVDNFVVAVRVVRASRTTVDGTEIVL